MNRALAASVTERGRGQDLPPICKQMIRNGLVALTGIEPTDRQFASVQLVLSSCVFSLGGISGSRKHRHRVLTS